MRTRTLLFSLLLLSVPPAVMAADAPKYPNATEGDYTIKNYRLSSGETLPEVKSPTASAAENQAGRARA